jgi:hypothetical protein
MPAVILSRIVQLVKLVPSLVRVGDPLPWDVRDLRDTAKPEFAVVSAISDKGLVLRMPPERLYGLPE